MRVYGGVTSFIQRFTEGEKILAGVDHPTGQSGAGAGGNQPLQGLVWGNVVVNRGGVLVGGGG